MILAFVFFYIYLARHRIAMSIAMLETASKALQKWPATAVVSLVSMVFSILWLGIWLAGFQAIYELASSSNKYTHSKGQALFWFFLLSLYWTSQVISTIVLTVAIGVLGEWYYKYPSNMEPNPTLRALKT